VRSSTRGMTSIF